MTRRLRLEPLFVETIPPQLEEGRLYVSRRYRTAVHLCCCGCGLEVVTPLNPAKWRLTEVREAVSLHPSIGNWSFPCQSHYWIRGNQVEWARAMPSWQIEQVRRRDQAAVDAMDRPPQPSPVTIVPPAPVEPSLGWWQKLVHWLFGR